MHRCFTLALLCCSLAAHAAETNKDTRAFHAFLAAEWDYTMEQAPDWASQLGDRRWNDRCPDLSLAAIEPRQAHTSNSLARLHRIDRRKLPPADQLSYDLFEYETKLALEEHTYRWFCVPLNQR